MPSKYKKQKGFEGSGDDSMRVGGAAACLQGTPYLLSLNSSRSPAGYKVDVCLIAAALLSLLSLSLSLCG
jgi:hypothetical protein